MGWGGGVGDVNVPCISYMIYCYAAEISGIVFYVTCCYAADGVGWGVGDVNVPCTSYMIHCYAAEISGIVYYVTCCSTTAVSLRRESTVEMRRSGTILEPLMLHGLLLRTSSPIH